MAIYDALAQDYQHGMARITGLHAGDLADALALGPGDRALDVAAGTGAITSPLAERVGAGGLVLAADIASGMLGIARGRLGGQFAQVRFLLTAAERLAVTDGAFDGVACGFGIQHMADPEAALRAMRAALRPGGHCAVSVWARVGEDIKTPINEAFAALAGAPLSPNQDTWSSPDFLARRLRDAGFRAVCEIESRGSLTVADHDEWWDAVTSGRLGDRLRAAGPEHAARVREDAYRRAERFAARNGGRWLFPSSAIIAVGIAP